ncbi:MAG TPA: hypothetical protein VF731_00325 [Solirubrobacterales bacterium]
MKSQQTPINARPKRRPQLPAAAHEAALAIEEKVIWPSEDALRAAGGGARRGADGLLWFLQRRLLWPLQDRIGGLQASGQLVATTIAVLVAVALGVAGVLWATSGGSGGATPAQRVADTQVAHVPAPATPSPEKSKPAPTLHGAAPVFAAPKEGEAKVGSAKGVASAAASSSSVTAEEGYEPTAAASSTSAATGKISSSPQAATDSTAARANVAYNGPPAGPEAIAVARKFASAFVVYEVGGTEGRVRSAFHATATRELSRALLRRPPKQPATVKVPQAKVVNVVAAPSHGSVYPVSVSLLRVGVTSELRLEMEKLKKGQWQVVNLLG